MDLFLECENDIDENPSHIRKVSNISDPNSAKLSSVRKIAKAYPDTDRLISHPRKDIKLQLFDKSGQNRKIGMACNGKGMMPSQDVGKTELAPPRSHAMNGCETSEPVFTSSCVLKVEEIDPDSTLLNLVHLENASKATTFFEQKQEDVDAVSGGKQWGDIKCTSCTSTFSNRQNMLRHMKIVHNEVPCEPRTLTKCSFCTATFKRQSYLLQHIGLKHSSIGLDNRAETKRSSSPRPRIQCGMCDVTFSTQTNLIRHIKAFHNPEAPSKTTKVISRRSAVKMKCSIQSCEFTCRRMTHLIDHLRCRHEQDMLVDTLIFQSRTAFDEWLVGVEDETPCKFLKRSDKESKDCRRVYYYCSRSGYARISTMLRQRNMKVRGSDKIQRTCPAHVVLFEKAPDHLEVKYTSKHFCHSSAHEQLAHLRLSQGDRMRLADRLAQKVPIDDILKDVKSKLDGNLKRIHFISRQDLRNIEHSFHLNESAEGVNDRNDEEMDVRSFIFERHAESLELNSIAAEIVGDEEWVVQSELASDEFYVVKRVLESCSCDRVCDECRACVHIYSCSCEDSNTYYNMCKHIHLICSKYPFASDANDIDNMVTSAEDESGVDVTCCANEAELNPSESSSSTEYLADNRLKALQLCSDVAQFIESTEDNEQMMAIIDCLKLVRPPKSGAICYAPSSNGSSESVLFEQASAESTTELSETTVEMRQHRVVYIKKWPAEPPGTITEEGEENQMDWLQSSCNNLVEEEESTGISY